MKIYSRILLAFLILSNKTIESMAEPFTLSIAFVAATGAALYGMYNYNTESCNSKWIDNQVTNLNNDLNKQVYGQHLVRILVPKLIQQHMKNENPEKALVLSFNGWTGNGKNYVSKIVANNIFKNYKKSEKSAFVYHFLIADFHTTDKESIRSMIKQKITSTVKKCARSLFIFDEIDRLPEGIIDVIKPFIDFNSFVDSVDYRKSIFIFLSNTGGTAITEKTYEFYKNGKLRNEITWKDMEPLIDSGAFNEKGGLRRSDIVEKSLIDAYIPFLPLEKKHVKLCIMDYLRDHYNKSNPNQDPGEQIIRQIAEQLEYDPPDTQIYSKTGCKKIGPKVDVFIDS